MLNVRAAKWYLTWLRSFVRCWQSEFLFIFFSSLFVSRSLSLPVSFLPTCTLRLKFFFSSTPLLLVASLNKLVASLSRNQSYDSPTIKGKKPTKIEWKKSENCTWDNIRVDLWLRIIAWRCYFGRRSASVSLLHWKFGEFEVMQSFAWTKHVVTILFEPHTHRTQKASNNNIKWNEKRRTKKKRVNK